MILFRSNITALEKVISTLVIKVDHNSQIYLRSAKNKYALGCAIRAIERAVRCLKEIV